MQDEENGQAEVIQNEGEQEFYGDTGISSFDAKVPKFLKAAYLFWPLWGIVSLCYFWNGSCGWLDRGYWHELQIAANTTFPIENQNMLPQNQPADQETEIEPPL